MTRHVWGLCRSITLPRAAVGNEPMSWKQSITDSLANTCRFLVRAGILIDAILLSLFSVWFVVRLLWFSLRALERTLFSKPW